MFQKLIDRLGELTWEKSSSGGILNPKMQADLSQLPLPLQKLYSIADGQKEGTPSLFEQYEFSSIERLLQSKKMMDELAKEQNWEKKWWNPNWFPFGDAGTGDHLVLDRETGKILEFIHDDEERTVVADSLDTYLKNLIRGLESGRLYFDPKLGIFDREAEKLAAKYSTNIRKINWKKFLLNIMLFNQPNDLSLAYSWKGAILTWLIQVVFICLFFTLVAISFILYGKIKSAI